MQPQVKQRVIEKRINLKHVLSQNTDEFCRNTTLHGLKYMASEELYPIERGFFAVSFAAVLLLSAFFIYKVYTKWATTPVILGINPEPSFITDEPFPAVTICNLNQALRSIAKNYDTDSTEYAMLQLLCKRAVNNTVAGTITDWSNLNTFILNISQPCQRMIISCRFGSVSFNCSELFAPIITDEGLCCVFNMLNPKFMHAANIGTFVHLGNVSNGDYTPVDWCAEMGYPAHLPAKFTPRVTAGTGESLGFNIVLDVELNEYYCSSSNSAGFKVSFHSPNESPNVHETGLLLAHGKETKVRLRPDKIVSEQHLRSVDKKYRHCLFHNEGKLLYFSHYTQRNCEMECVARLVIKHCGCIAYYMPKVFKNASICNIHKNGCVRRVRLKTDSSVENCHDACLPSCFDLNFFADFFSTPISHNGFGFINPSVANFSDAYVEKNIAVVKMYFKENLFRSKIQTEFIGISDFLSSVGGLMGLFLGFSFISIAEFIYFAVLRPYRAYSHQKIAKSNPLQQPRILKNHDNQLEKKSYTALRRRNSKKRSLENYKKFGNMLYPRFSKTKRHEVLRFGQPQIDDDALRSNSKTTGGSVETSKIYPSFKK